MLQLARYPDMLLAAAAQDLAPHDVTFYLRELAAAYHSYYDAERILVDDETVKMPAWRWSPPPRRSCTMACRCWACRPRHECCRTSPSMIFVSRHPQRMKPDNDWPRAPFERRGSGSGAVIFAPPRRTRQWARHLTWQSCWACLCLAWRGGGQQPPRRCRWSARTPTGTPTPLRANRDDWDARQLRSQPACRAPPPAAAWHRARRRAGSGAGRGRWAGEIAPDSKPAISAAAERPGRRRQRRPSPPLRHHGGSGPPVQRPAGDLAGARQPAVRHRAAAAPTRLPISVQAGAFRTPTPTPSARPPVADGRGGARERARAGWPHRLPVRVGPFQNRDAATA